MKIEHRPSNYFRIGQIIVFLLPIVLILGCQQELPTYKPTFNQITEAIYASTTIVPEHQYQVFPSVNGPIEEKHIEVGDTVKAGAPLFRLKNTAPELNQERAYLGLTQAKDAYSGSNSRLKEIAQQIERAQLRYEQDSIDYLRQQSLWDQQIGSLKELEQRALALEVAKNDLNTLRNQYQRVSEELERQVELAENQYRLSLSNTGDFTVYSQIEGVVFAVNKEVGEIASTQQPLALIGDYQTFVASLRIDEVDIGKVKIGQKAIISLDAYPDMVFDAIVSKIFPSLDARSQTLEIEARFEVAPPRLYNGMTGETNIIIKEKEKALVVPKSYLLNGHRIITTNDTVEVEVGLQSLEWVEILGGIDTSTAIVKPQ